MKLYASLVLSACFIQVYSLPQKTDKRYSAVEFGHEERYSINDRKGRLMIDLKPEEAKYDFVKKRSAETDSVNVLDMITMSEALYNAIERIRKYAEKNPERLAKREEGDARKKRAVVEGIPDVMIVQEIEDSRYQQIGEEYLEKDRGGIREY